MKKNGLLFLAVFMAIVWHLFSLSLFFHYRYRIVESRLLPSSEPIFVEVVELALSLGSEQKKQEAVETKETKKTREAKEMNAAPPQALQPPILIDEAVDHTEKLPTSDNKPQDSSPASPDKPVESDFYESPSLQAYEQMRLHGRSQYSVIARDESTKPAEKTSKKASEKASEKTSEKTSKKSVSAQISSQGKSLHVSMNEAIQALAESCYPESYRAFNVRGSAVIAIIRIEGMRAYDVRLEESTGDMLLDFCALSVAESILKLPDQLAILQKQATKKGQYLIRINF